MKRLFSLVLPLVAATALAQSAPRIDSINPNVSPTAGGVDVTINGAGFNPPIFCIVPCPTTVTFDTIKVVPDRITDTQLVVKAPAHAAGTVDVTVTAPGGQSTTARAAFTYTDTPYRAVWEPVLVPVYIETSTPGAGGSQWKTDLWIQNLGSKDLSIVPWPCPADEVCPAVYPLTRYLKPNESQHNLGAFFRVPDSVPPYRLVYFNRDAADGAALNLRVYDSARSTLDAGTEVPVVRERELLKSRTMLMNIPTAGNRFLLRVYDVALTDAMFHVRVFPQSEAADAQPLAEYDLRATTTTTLELREFPAYAQQTIELPAVAAALTAIRVEVTPLSSGSQYWAFVSVTNNTTSHVTTVTPQ